MVSLLDMGAWIAAPWYRVGSTRRHNNHDTRDVKGWTFRDLIRGTAASGIALFIQKDSTNPQHQSKHGRRLIKEMVSERGEYVVNSVELDTDTTLYYTHGRGLYSFWVWGRRRTSMLPAQF